MAVLSESQLIELIKNPNNKDLLADAVYYENRLQMLTIPYDSAPTHNPAYNNLINRWECELPSDCFSNLMLFNVFPLKTVPVYQQIYSMLGKIWDSNNAHSEVVFEDSNSEDKILFDKQLDKTFNFWSEEGFKEFKTNPCSFVLHDFPRDQNEAGTLPEIKQSFIRLEDVQDCVLKEDNVTPEYIIYKISENDFIAIDDEKRVLINKTGAQYTVLEVVPTFTEEIPVRSLYSTVLDGNPFKKGLPEIASTLGIAETFWLLSVAEDIPSMYAYLPVIVEYGSTDNYDEKGNAFDYTEVDGKNGVGSGIWRNQYGRTREDEKKLRSRSVGGRKVTIPLPSEEQPDIARPAVEYIATPVDSLARLEEETARRRNDIITVATGANSDVINDQAINIDQVESINERSRSVLFSLKGNFEKVMKWCTDQKGEILFGDKFVTSFYNLGTQFFLLSSFQIEEVIKESKAAGYNDSQLQVLYFMWFDTKFKTEPKQAERMKILFEIEPFPTRDFKELENQRDIIDPVQWNIKLNFNTYVAKFERELTPINGFNKEVTKDTKINLITEQIEEYARERVTVGREAEADTQEATVTN